MKKILSSLTVVAALAFCGCKTTSQVSRIGDATFAAVEETAKVGPELFKDGLSIWDRAAASVQNIIGKFRPAPEVKPTASLAPAESLTPERTLEVKPNPQWQQGGIVLTKIPPIHLPGNDNLRLEDDPRVREVLRAALNSQ